MHDVSIAIIVIIYHMHIIIIYHMHYIYRIYSGDVMGA
jgi:hypothetical protein